MNRLLDTNILLYLTRAKDRRGLLRFIDPNNSNIYISVVSEAEIRSMALRNNWGTKRVDLLEETLDGLNIIEINKLHVNAYAEIDAYSQRSNPAFAAPISQLLEIWVKMTSG